MSSHDLAIVGASCRLPGDVVDLSSFWRLLDAGRCAVTEIPDERWTKSAFFSPDRRAPGKSYTWAAGVIDGIDRFDPEFFGFSPREAGQMDPQQRLALELAAEALDDAALGFDRLAGSRTGVFVGVSNKDFGDLRIGDPASGDAYFMTGNASSIVANRVSYAFDLQGPSYIVDTACSSALVAFDAACRAVRGGDAEMALVGGVNVLLSPFPFIGFSRAGMLSPRGRCRPFDATGDGYVRAEGGGFVVVKPLDRALADGDRIRAVVKGTGTNADGRTVGLSLPNAATQAALLAGIYGGAGLDAARLAYLEAHGTGTAAGDPAEAASIGQVLGRARRRPLPIGSVKGNIGHLEPASGMAGLLKALLVFEHGRIPASLFFDTPNPAIDFDDLNLRVAARAQAVDGLDDDALIGINSFGFGGANAHVVLAPPPRAATVRSARRPRRRAPLLVSAHSPAALESERQALLARLRQTSSSAIYDLAWTWAFRRRHERHRLWLAGGTAPELRRQLEAAATPVEPGSTVRSGTVVVSRARTVFVFAGNGSQWAGMGRALLADDRGFARTVDAVDALFAPLAGFSIRAAMEAGDAEDVARTEVAQPLLFALQLGLVQRLRALGLTADAMLGHSVGEVAAACASGALSLRDAVHVLYHRSRAQGLTRGAGRMLAISLPRAALDERLAGLAPDVEIAGFNSVEDFTLAGPEAQLRALVDALADTARFVRLLDLDYAFHSRAMDPVEADIRRSLADVGSRRPRTSLFSTVTGRAVAARDLGADYWWRNVREPVRFADGLAEALAAGPAVVVEIGPRPVLTAYVRAVARQADQPVTVVRGLSEAAPGSADLAAMVGEAHVNGAVVDWSRQFGAPGRVETSGVRAFARERYWFDRSGRGFDTVYRDAGRPLLGLRRVGAEHGFELDLDLAAMPWLADHEVDGAVVMPAAGFLEIGLAAAEAVFGAPAEGDLLAVRNLHILRPLTIERGKIGRLRVDVQAIDGRLTVAASPANDPASFAVFAVARVERVEGRADDLPAVERAAPSRRDVAAFYEEVAGKGLRYGPAFQRLVELEVSHGWARGHLRPADEPPFMLSPTAVDAAFQALLALLPDHDDAIYLPVGCEELERVSPAPPVAFEARLTRRNPRSIAAQIAWYDQHGDVVARARGCRFQVAASLRGDTSAPSRLRTVLRRRRLGHRLNGDRPAPTVIVDGARTRLDDAVTAAEVRAFREEVAPLLAAAAAGYARRALAPAFEGEPPTGIDEVARRLGVPGPSRPLLRRLVAMLEEDGLLDRSGEAWQLIAQPTLPEPEPILRSVIADGPEYAAETILLARAGGDLDAKLRGEAVGGEASGALAGPAFGHWQVASPVVTTSNRIMLDALARWIERWPADRPVRVLNISIGDSAFAKALGSLVAPSHGEIVHAILTAEAKAELEAFLPDDAGVRVVAATLAEADPIAGGGFDLVVANHVLFMTGDDERALRAIWASLAEEGTLVLSERQSDRLGDLLFAGQPRWWQPAGETTLLPRLGHAQHWIAALEANDFVFTDAVQPVAELEPGESFQLVAVRPRQIVPAVLSPSDRAASLVGVPSEVASLLADGLRQCGIDSAPAAAHKAIDRIEWVGSAPARAVASERIAGLVESVFARVAQVDGVARLWVVLADRADADSSLPADPADAALVGALRVLANEHPDLRLRIVELRGFASAVDVVHALVDEIAAVEGGENEVILTPRGRRVPRVTDEADAKGAPVAGPAVLDIPAAGSLTRLVWRPLERRRPRADEVEIEVAATGLNFRDVMLSLGLLGDDAVEDGFAGATLGMECSGTVVAAGEAVDELQVGDRVVAFAPSCFATHVTTTTSAVAPIPAGVSLEAAATVPTVFFSAYYALKHLAQLQPGETVLIHGAAGGVGLAAIQLVQALGGEAIVTAGSEEKQAFLRLLGLDRISTSRSLRFVDDVEELTGGAGVDIVLNSLAGAAIEKSLALLKPFGRFLELGKRDLYADSPMGLRPFRRNLSYFGIDADQVMAQQPQLARRLFREMLDLMRQGALRPIPYRSFDANSVGEAFALMQTSRHIGKIVVRLDPPPIPREAAARGRAATPRFVAPDDGWLVVTGGLRGFGLETARWLAARGARRLALYARRGLDAEADSAIADLRAAGVTVEAAALDVTDAAAVAATLAGLRRVAPIRGVFHTAAVFEDGAWSTMDAGRIARVVAPKVDGAVALHRTSAADDLAHFVVYSSATTIIGNPGQANYVAANLALEQLMAERRAQGLPGLAVLWGPIADAGYLARNEAVKRTLESRFGRRELTARAALDVLGDLLAAGEQDRVVAHLDWSRTRAMPALREAARFSELRTRAGEAGGADEEGSLADRLAGKPREQARAVVQDALAKVVASILRLPVERIAPDTSLMELGMDSLMGVELGLAAQQELGIDLPVSGLGAGVTLDGLVDRVMASISGQTEAADESVAARIAQQHGVEASAELLQELYHQAPTPAAEHKKVSLLS